MQFLRKIFFYFFAAIYIVVCPLVILYAVGYLYRPGTEGGVVETGLISLTTVPAGASIYINESLCAEKTPALIRELLPDDYAIRLELNSYMPWERTVWIGVHR